MGSSTHRATADCTADAEPPRATHVPPSATVAVNEEGPGIGVYISLALGLVAGVVVAFAGGGWIGFVIAFVVVGLVGALLLS